MKERVRGYYLPTSGMLCAKPSLHARSAAAITLVSIGVGFLVSLPVAVVASLASDGHCMLRGVVTCCGAVTQW